MAATILIVEDEHAVARGIQYALQQEGYEVAVARSGEEGLEIATRQAPDLVVLDVRLPGMDGFEVLRRLRAAGAKMPVLVLTARDDEVDKVIGLELGADDYLPKPYYAPELVARLRAVLRRRNGARVGADEGAELALSELRVNAPARRATWRNAPIQLTTTEFNLLVALLQFGDRVATRDQLSRNVLGRPRESYDRSIDVHVNNLRQKLLNASEGAVEIETVRGVGYRAKSRQ